jgi:hypothetical protein
MKMTNLNIPIGTNVKYDIHDGVIRTGVIVKSIHGETHSCYLVNGYWLLNDQIEII